MAASDELLKEMRDDIKTLLTTSAVSNTRIEHVETAVTELNTKFDARAETIYMIESSMMTKGDCQTVRDRGEKQAGKKRTNWIAVLAVCAAFIAAGATAAMAYHNMSGDKNAVNSQVSTP